MSLSRKFKIGLAAFVAFDILVLFALLFLFNLRSDRADIAELTKIGVAVYPQARELTPITLIDNQGRSFSNADLVDSWTLMFFGFTNCPDICPLTMAELKQFYESMEAQGLVDDLGVIMVSVDPERDSPEQMNAYVKGFNENFIGLTGSATAVAELADQLFIATTEPQAVADHGNHSDAEDYLIGHSGHIAVINKSGMFKAAIRPPVRNDDIESAVKILRGL